MKTQKPNDQVVQPDFEQMAADMRKFLEDPEVKALTEEAFVADEAIMAKIKAEQEAKCKPKLKQANRTTQRFKALVKEAKNNNGKKPWQKK